MARHYAGAAKLLDEVVQAMPAYQRGYLRRAINESGARTGGRRAAVDLPFPLLIRILDWYDASHQDPETPAPPLP